jgi:hypothetical protein
MTEAASDLEFGSMQKEEQSLTAGWSSGSMRRYRPMAYKRARQTGWFC